MMKIDNIDKKLLNILQSEFPLNREPFSLLGVSLGISGDEVIHRIEELKAKEIIRLIGPVLNPKRLGYRTTLVAARLPGERLNRAVRIINGHPMVSHCYERDHDFNLWFTLAVPVATDLEDKVRKLGNQIRSETVLNLPAIKTFKIGAYFNIAGGASDSPLSAKRGNLDSASSKNNHLSTIDRAVIDTLQQDLPLTERPFDLMSAEISIGANEFLSLCQTLLQRGIMRRFSASINHNKLGFTANAMACWQVPPAMVNTTGEKIATFPEVSHCYQRQTKSLWPYNLFAMVHADNKENCRAIIDKICLEAGLNKRGQVILFSTREVKKTRVKYKV